MFQERSRAKSFSAIAQLYDHYRPQHPPALADALLTDDPQDAVALQPTTADFVTTRTGQIGHGACTLATEFAWTTVRLGSATIPPGAAGTVAAAVDPVIRAAACRSG